MSRVHFPRLRALVRLFVVSACLYGGTARAAEAQTTEPKPLPPTLKIASVSCGAAADLCELGKLLQVQLESSAPWKGRSLDTLLLVVNGVPFEHITARTLDNNGNKLWFKLDAQLDPGQWKTLYAGQDAHADFYVALAVREPGNLASTTPVLTLVSNALQKQFQVRPDRRWVIYAALAALVLAVVVLARRSNLLRAPGQTVSGQPRPYSLARTQLAAWTLTIIGSYLFIWAVLGNTDPLNDTALILMGLSALTGMGATLIDNSKPVPPGTAPAGAAPAAPAVPAAPAPAAPPPAAPPAPPPAAPALAAATAPDPSTRGFLLDILSDPDGVSISRFQMAVWTLVLIVVFLYTVWNTLAMPTFSAVLLGLMGISNGTYVGLKLPTPAK